MFDFATTRIFTNVGPWMSAMYLWILYKELKESAGISGIMDHLKLRGQGMAIVYFAEFALLHSNVRSANRSTGSTHTYRHVQEAHGAGTGNCPTNGGDSVYDEILLYPFGGSRFRVVGHIVPTYF